MKSKTLFLSFIINFIFIKCYSQTYFQNVYFSSGNAQGTSIQQTMDGGFILAGAVVKDTSGLDVFLIKTNPIGDTTWTKIFSTAGDNRSSLVRQTSDSGYIVSCYSVNFPNLTCIIKTDSHGDTLWVRQYGTTGTMAVNSLIQTSDDGYMLAATSFSFDQDIYLIRLNSIGDTLWTRRGGVPNYNSFCYSVQQTLDSGFIFAGYARGPVTLTYDCFLIKTDANGDTLWTKSYGGPGTEMGYCVRQTTDGGFILAGKTSGNGGGFVDDFYLIKTDAAGNVMWAKNYGDSTCDEIAYSVEITSDGGYLLWGETCSFGAGDYDECAMKTDSAGNLQWAYRYGGTGQDHGISGAPTTDGGYISIGNTTSFINGMTAAYMIKTESNGHSGCNESIEILYENVFATPTSAAFGLESIGGNIDTIAFNIKRGISKIQPCLGVGMDEELNESELIVYPNPFSDWLNIKGIENDGILSIYDLKGHQILNISCNNSITQFNAESISPGFYAVRYFTPRGKSKYLKMVKLN